MRDFIRNNKSNIILVLGLAAVICLSMFDPSSIMSKVGEYFKPKAEEQRARRCSDIQGAVISPGMYCFDFDARITDLIAAAGGIGHNANVEFVSKNLNISEYISDAAKYYVPFNYEKGTKSVLVSVPLLNEGKSEGGNTNSENNEGESSVESGDKPVSGLVNVNKCDKDTLISLPKIGEAYAERIINNRPYTDFLDFQNKSTLPKTYSDQLKTLITF